LARVAPAGEQLLKALEALKNLPVVGDLRGRGLLVGVELVKDRTSREPFAPEQKLADRIYQAALEEGVVTYPIQGCVDGERGDHILLAPPYIVSGEEIAEIARALEKAIARAIRS